MSKHVFAQIGAGRIGKMHAGHLSSLPNVRIKHVVDHHAPAAAALAASLGATASDMDGALGDKDVTAVIITSSTNTHADFIEAAAKAGKAIFCEKPVDLTMSRVETCLATVKACQVPLMIGFNRRFDPQFAALKRQIDEGVIGKVEHIVIYNRDAAPPPPGFVPTSGGLFRDMSIHDFDMARWLLGEEPNSVFAVGSNLVDPEIGRQGDIDTGTITMTTASGKQVVINTARRATFGYDQRIEVSGEKGLLQAGNTPITTVSASTAAGVTHSLPHYNFITRYADAFRLELSAFVQSLDSGTPPAPTGEDGRLALRLAEAANESMASGRAVKV
jgi:myo-inositol 2-dehydrogenase/D-chiro-inositol 1-dehydrogenase